MINLMLAVVWACSAYFFFNLHELQPDMARRFAFDPIMIGWGSVLLVLYNLLRAFLWFRANRTRRDETQVRPPAPRVVDEPPGPNRRLN